MKKIILLAFFIGALLCQSVFAENTDNFTNELKEARTVIAQLAADVHSGKTTEAALSGDFKQMDTLLAKHKDKKDEIMAETLYIKSQVYADVLGEDDKADAIMDQITKDYGDSPLAKDIKKEEEKQAEEAKINASLVPGVQLPDFNEKDIQGGPLSLASHKGKVVLVDFWATWCVPCRIEFPNVLAAYQKYHDQGFEIIGVSLDKDPKAVSTFLKQNDVPWQQYFDGLGWNNKLAQKYGVQGIPATYLLDANGKILAKNLHGNELSEAIAKAVVGK